MSALDDIGKAIKSLAPVKPGWERVIFVGISAERSILAERRIRDEHRGDLPDQLFNTPVMRANWCDGWDIRDMDQAGKWHDAEVRAA